MQDIMNKYFYAMINNEQIFDDGGSRWFVDHMENILYRINALTEECEVVAGIPCGDQVPYKANPLCIKYGNCVMCLPVTNNCIWIYDIKQNKIQDKIEIDNPNSVVIGFRFAWIKGNVLWAWASGLKCIVEIDLEVKKINNYHKIPRASNEELAYEVLNVNNQIYLFSNSRKVLYEFDIVTKKTTEYEIQKINKDVNTICYDEGLFWFSGTDRYIYVLNKETNDLKLMTDFPPEFKIVRSGQKLSTYQKSLFYLSVSVNGYICFVPWGFCETVCTGVLFVNTRTYQMKVVKLDSEYDNKKEPYYYAIEYINNDRYIGIYYSHNPYISEIDTETFDVTEKRMKFSRESYTKIFIGSSRQGVFQEKNENDLEAFIGL